MPTTKRGRSSWKNETPSSLFKTKTPPAPEMTTSPQPSICPGRRAGGRGPSRGVCGPTVTLCGCPELLQKTLCLVSRRRRNIERSSSLGLCWRRPCCSSPNPQHPQPAGDAGAILTPAAPQRRFFILSFLGLFFGGKF